MYPLGSVDHIDKLMKLPRQMRFSLLLILRGVHTVALGKRRKPALAQRAPTSTFPGCRNWRPLCVGNLLLAVLKKNVWKMKAQFENEQSESGEFQRQADAFRDWIS